MSTLRVGSKSLFLGWKYCLSRDILEMYFVQCQAKSRELAKQNRDMLFTIPNKISDSGKTPIFARITPLGLRKSQDNIQINNSAVVRSVHASCAPIDNTISPPQLT
jgi:hypothetical protein